MAKSYVAREAVYPSSAFNTWVEYKLDQKCEFSDSDNGLYTPTDIIKEINDKLKTKYTIRRLYDWRNRTDRTVPDAVINDFVNPEMHLVMSWYFTKKGYFNTSIDTDDLALAFSVPAKIKHEA